MTGKFQVDHANVSARMLDDEVVIIHMVSTHYYNLNASGAVMWNLLSQKPQGLADLVQAVAHHYSLSMAEVEGDVKALLDLLLEEELLLSR